MVLVLSGWTDLDQDGFIDQFIVEPVLPGILGVAGFVSVLPLFLGFCKPVGKSLG